LPHDTGQMRGHDAGHQAPAVTPPSSEGRAAASTSPTAPAPDSASDREGGSLAAIQCLSRATEAPTCQGFYGRDRLISFNRLFDLGGRACRIAHERDRRLRASTWNLFTPRRLLSGHIFRSRDTMWPVHQARAVRGSIAAPSMRALTNETAASG
jgi:hypothetical protein